LINAHRLRSIRPELGGHRSLLEVKCRDSLIASVGAMSTLAIAT